MRARFAISAITQVSIGRDDRGDHLFGLVVGDEGQRLGEVREGVGVGVGTTKAPPTSNVNPTPTSRCSPGINPTSWAKTSTQLSRGCATAIFELSRQIGLTVERPLFKLLSRDRLLSVHEDLPMRLGSRAERFAQLTGDALKGTVAVLELQCRAGDHVSHDVAAFRRRN